MKSHILLWIIPALQWSPDLWPQRVINCLPQRAIKSSSFSPGSALSGWRKESQIITQSAWEAASIQNSSLIGGRMAGMISSEQGRSLVKHLCWLWFFSCSSRALLIFRRHHSSALLESPWEPHSGSRGSLSSLGGFFSEAQKAKATPRCSECFFEFLSLCFSKGTTKISQ